MIKLIASDLDGTLLQNQAQHLSDDILEIISKLLKMGIHYVSASGRQYSNQVSLYGKELATSISIISDNGAMYVHNGCFHIQQPLDKDLVKRLIQAVREKDSCELVLSSKDTLYFESGNEAFLHHMLEVMENQTEVVDDLFSVDDTIIKMAIYDASGTSNSESYFRTLFGDDCVVVTSGNCWIDFIAHGVNKGTALKHLIDELGIKPEECLVFGDQYNDIEMLELAGISYAMENGAPGVSGHATHTTNSVEETLRELFKIKKKA